MNRYSKLFCRLQAGLSMIEVLVSLTIVAFSVLGLLGLQARAMSFQRDSFDRRTAAEMVAQLAERMRANHLGLVSGFYDRDLVPGVAFDLDATSLTPVAIAVCAAVPCSTDELALRDWTQWLVEYRQRSPGAAAYLQWDPVDARFVTVSVAWPEPQAVADPDPNALCNRINVRLGVAIPANYRCFETAVFP